MEPKAHFLLRRAGPTEQLRLRRRHRWTHKDPTEKTLVAAIEDQSDSMPRMALIRQIGCANAFAIPLGVSSDTLADVTHDFAVGVEVEEQRSVVFGHVAKQEALG
jgi:hypothetical protein